MNQYQHLIQTLRQFPSLEWIIQYFDLVKSIFSEYGITPEDERVAFVLGKSETITLNFGSRNLLQPITGKQIACAVRPDFSEKDFGGELIYTYKNKNGQIEAKLVRLHFVTVIDFPNPIRDQLSEVAQTQLNNSQRSRFRKFHEPLLYDFTMELAVRDEILSNLKTSAV